MITIELSTNLFLSAGTNVEHVTGATGTGMLRGQLKKESMNLPGKNKILKIYYFMFISLELN